MSEMSGDCKVVFYKGKKVVFVGNGTMGFASTDQGYRNAFTSAGGEWEFITENTPSLLTEKNYSKFGTDFDKVEIAGKMFKVHDIEGLKVLEEMDEETK